MSKKQNIKSFKLPIISKCKINQEKGKEHKLLRGTTIFLIVFIILLTLFSGYSMAKYVHGVIINGKAQIAEPILVVENNPAMDITAINNYGEYTFRIKNYNDQNKITEVDLKYYIEILSNVDESINIELYQGENKIELNNNKTEYIQISKNQKEDREYKMIITYDKNKSNSIEDIMEKIQVKVHTEQVKA